MFKQPFRRYLSLALVLALVLTASFGSSGQAAAAGETDLGRAIAAQEAHTDALMAIDGVIGTAVGRGAGGGHVVLALTTAAGISGIPGAVDGVIVRPYVTGEIFAQPKPGSDEVDRTARFDRPVPIGVSTGHPDITAGTIGARVFDSNGNLYALSNNHIYANQNAAAIGDAVIQPGTFDDGELPEDDIGTLWDFEPIKFDGTDNTIDAAIVAVGMVDEDDGPVLAVGNATPHDGYGTPSSTPMTAAVGMSVMKYGRTTGQTDGKVDAINATVNVNYGSPNGTALFVGQVIIKGKKGSFSAGGDSGSFIVSSDGNHPVALLFAGSSTVTIGNPIDAVLAHFGVTVDDGSAPAPSPEFGSISGSVTDSSDASAIAGATVSTATGQSGVTAVDGSYLITDVPVGSADVTAAATGFETSSVQTVTVNKDSVTSNVDFALIAVVTAENVIVSSISYETSGGRSGSKHLFITIALLDDLSNPVEGATVSISVDRNSVFFGSGTGVTGVEGTITFKASNAPKGTYTTAVTDVSAAGLLWDGTYPPNSFVKE